MINQMTFGQKIRTYAKHPGSLVLFLLVTCSAVLTMGLLLFLIVYILVKGVPHLTPSLFAWKYTTENVSMTPAIINTVFLTAISLLIAVPCGIGAAIYLAEYAKRGNAFVKLIRLMAETLSGIPSIVYGLFGMLCFVTTLGWNYSLLAGSCTISLMILPLILRTTEEALLSVPDSYRVGCRKISYHFKNCVTGSGTRNFGRSDFGNRTYCRRNCSASVHLRHSG